MKTYLRNELNKLKLEIDDIPMESGSLESVIIALMNLRKIVAELVDQLPND